VAVNEPPSFRTALRVTKYDPAFRAGGRGAFTGDDWTSVSDVGESFNGEVLTLDTYLAVEAQHLQVVAAFLDEARVDHAVVRAAEAHDARWWPVEGERLSPLETVDVVREMLRERGFCRLEGERGVYVHVGYDYHLYLGGDVPSEQTLRTASRVGLFADEAFTSPYHVDPATGEYF
jgi:hypothetical protein